MKTSKKQPNKKQPENYIEMNPRDELPSFIRQVTATRLFDIIQEAENGDTRNLFALYRDIISSDNQILTEFTKRKGAIISDTINMIPWDKKNQADVDSKDLCWSFIDSDPFNDAVDWLLNATLYPVAVAEKIFEPNGSGYSLKAIMPVHYQLLDYREGKLKIFDTDENGHPLSTSHDPDPNRYIIHRGHIMPIPDQWGGPMRSILFWWLLRTMSRQWWADFLERFGVPFLKGKYSDPDGRRVLERAFRLATKLGAIVISKGTEAEIVQATASDKSDSHERFIELCNREISKLITGQTLSTQAQPTGELGGGTANLQGQVRDDLRKMDARKLANTLRTQLCNQFIAINNQTGFPPVIIFGSDSVAETASQVNLIKALSDAGFEPDDDGVSTLSERVGFGIRRKQSASPLPFSAIGLNALVNDSIASSKSSDLAAAFRGHYAPVAQIIRSSKSPNDCIRAVRSWALSADVPDISNLLEKSLIAYCAAGARQT